MESFFKNDTNELTYKTETDSPDIENKLTVTKGEGGGKDKSGIWD